MPPPGAPRARHTVVTHRDSSRLSWKAASASQEVARPVGDGVLEHAAAERPHAPSLLGRRHLDGPHDRVLEPADVVRVDPDRAAELVGGAGELAQHEHAAIVDPRGDVLLRDEVHPVSQRRHEHDVGGKVQRDHLLARVGLVQVADGGVVHRVVVAVDAADGELDLVPQLDVGGDAFAARAGDLHERDVLDR